MNNLFDRGGGNRSTANIVNLKGTGRNAVSDIVGVWNGESPRILRGHP